MVVYDFYIVEITISLSKAYAVLIVDANAVLPLPVTVQRFKSIRWWNPQIVYCLRSINHEEFPERYPLDSRW